MEPLPKGSRPMNDVRFVTLEALRAVRNDKRLWVFGFFVASGAGGSFNVSLPGDGEAPSWVFVLAAVVAVLVLVSLVLHVVSEGALIGAIHRRAERRAMVAHWREGASFALRLAGIKSLTLLASLAIVALVAAPVAAGVLDVMPLPLGIAMAVLATILAVPSLLTLYLVQEVSARLVVLEGRGVRDGLRAARDFLRGRLRYALKLLVVDGVAQVALAVVAAPIVALCAGAAFVVYLTGGLVPAIITGVVLVLPIAVPLTAARGTFRSALWTLGVVDQRPSLG